MLQVPFRDFPLSIHSCFKYSIISIIGDNKTRQKTIMTSIVKVPEEVIQYLAGHTNETMTKHYRRISKSVEEERKDLAKEIPFEEVSVRYQSQKGLKAL